MNVADLRKACSDAIGRSGDKASVYLVVPGPKGGPRGDRVRLATPGSPLGAICCVHRDNSVVGVWPASSVLAWLDKKGLTDASR